VQFEKLCPHGKFALPIRNWQNGFLSLHLRLRELRFLRVSQVYRSFGILAFCVWDGALGIFPFDLRFRIYGFPSFRA
jgi:hypothetical protein